MWLGSRRRGGRLQSGIIPRSARLARRVALLAFGGAGGAFIDAVALASVIVVPATCDGADQDQREQIDPTSLWHGQSLLSLRRDGFEGLQKE